jgi:hypothetical protein
MQQMSANLAPDSSDRSPIVKPFVSTIGMLNSPGTTPQPNFSLGRLPIALKSELDEPYRNERLPLAAIAPIAAALKRHENHGSGETIVGIEDFEMESDDERNLKPCHPKMTE